MKITGVTLWDVSLTSHETYYMSDGKTCDSISTIVLRLETETDHVGWGEVCPIPHYLPAYAKGVAPALQMHDQGLRVGLGTDGPMSGNTLDIIGQMGYVAKLHKLDNKDRSVMPPLKVVEMATIGGARAIHREDELGSLEAGKLADIAIVEVKSANMVPMYSPYSALVYSANASNVDTVIVNGKVIVEDKQLLTYDEDQSRAMMLEFSKQVSAIAETL